MTSARALLRYLARPASVPGMLLDLAGCALALAVMFALGFGWIA